MQTRKVWYQFRSLSPEKQQEVADFILFLHKQDSHLPGNKQIKKTKLTGERFIGLWKDRKEMEDDASWLRQLRQSEWGRTR